MAYNELLADRVRNSLSGKRAKFHEKKMFGGLCFMVDDKMCIGIRNEDIMLRLDPEIEQHALQQKGSRPMDFTGRPMKGYIYVSNEGTDMDKDLDKWVQMALDYNPKAKSSKKKK